MFLEWLVYTDAAGARTVIIVEAPSLIHARLRTAVSGLDGGDTFVEGHELDHETAKRVPKSAIGKRLSQQEAAKVLAKLGE